MTQEKRKPRISHLTRLIFVWWAGAAIAGGALLIPVYWTYFVVAAIGWIILLVCSALIIYEIKKTKAEDKRKSELA